MSLDREFAPDWMYDCLEEAKKIINTHHHQFDCKEFLEKTEYRLWIQTDKPNAYGYIIDPQIPRPFYNIAIHKVLSELNQINIRMVTIVLVHELLHSIHPNDENYIIVGPLEIQFANKAGYYDALREMENLAYNGRMKFCDE